MDARVGGIGLGGGRCWKKGFDGGGAMRCAAESLDGLASATQEKLQVCYFGDHLHYDIGVPAGYG